MLALRSLSKTLIIPLIVGLVGLLTALAGLASATIWKPDPTVAAKGTPTAAQAIVTRPGVLELLDNTVNITATAEADSDVVIVVGRAADVYGWAGNSKWAEATGVSGSTQLVLDNDAKPAAITPAPAASDAASPAPSEAASAAPASAPAPSATASATPETEAAANPIPNPSTTNIWLSQSVGKGSATMKWEAGDMQVAALIWTEKGAPTATLQWQTAVTTPYLQPLLTIGGILMLLAIALWYLLWLGDRRRAEAVPERVSLTERKTETIALGGETIAPSRRALREARERGEIAIVIGDQEFPTGLIPIVEPAADTAVAEAVAGDSTAAGDPQAALYTAAVGGAPGTVEDDSEAASGDHAAAPDAPANPGDPAPGAPADSVFNQVDTSAVATPGLDPETGSDALSAGEEPSDAAPDSEPAANEISEVGAADELSEPAETSDTSAAADTHELAEPVETSTPDVAAETLTETGEIDLSDWTDLDADPSIADGAGEPHLVAIDDPVSVDDFATDWDQPEVKDN